MVLLSHAHKTKQVLAVILVRQQHMPGCFFRRAARRSQSEEELSCPIPSHPCFSLCLLPVISCHYSVLLMSDPERRFFSVLSDTRCTSVRRKIQSFCWVQFSAVSCACQRIIPTVHLYSIRDCWIYCLMFHEVCASFGSLEFGSTAQFTGVVAAQLIRG